MPRLRAEIVLIMKGEQISFFSLLDEYETPIIPPEEQKQGTKGWIIQFNGIFLRENGFDHDRVGVETRPIVLESDTWKKNGIWEQNAATTKGPWCGWYGQYKTIFRTRPTWQDCLLWARENHKSYMPETVEYYSQTGDWHGIYRYEDGF